MRLRNIPEAREAIANSPYVIHEPMEMKDKWSGLWEDQAPIHIEIGMGKGQFITTLAKENPNIHYIGIERFSSVLYRALQKMDLDPLPNLRFICDDAEHILDFFGEDEIDRIYLNFSDPWPKDRHAKRRLTSRQYLARYDVILKPEGRLEFKTDNDLLFDFSLEEIKESTWNLDAFTYDLHHDETMSQGNVMTEYEEKFSGKGNPIHKLIASH